MRKFKVFTMIGNIVEIKARTFEVDRETGTLFFWDSAEARAAFRNWDHFIEIID